MMKSPKNPLSCLLGPIVCLLIVAITGCARENPGSWPKEKVLPKIAESLEMTDVELTPLPEGGGFSGTGKRADGETITFTITQDPAASRMSWDAKGDRGFIEDGYYELK